MKDTKLLPSQPLCNGYTYHHIKLLAKNSCQLSYEMKISNNYTLNYSKYCFCKKKKKLRHTLHTVKLTLW